MVAPAEGCEGGEGRERRHSIAAFPATFGAHLHAPGCSKQDFSSDMVGKQKLLLFGCRPRLALCRNLSLNERCEVVRVHTFAGKAKCSQLTTVRLLLAAACQRCLSVRLFSPPARCAKRSFAAHSQ